VSVANDVFIRVYLCLSVVLLALGAVLPARAQQQLGSHIGYVYPAGGRQGTSVQVKIGGQFLDGLTNVHVSGTGVAGRVVEYVKPLTQIQINALRDQVKALQEKRQAAMRWRRGLDGAAGTNVVFTAQDGQNLVTLAKKLAAIQRRPANPAIAETATLQVTIAPDAELGPRDFRVSTRLGLSNPSLFCIGQWPEFRKREPAESDEPPFRRSRNDNEPKAVPPTETSITLPATVNGQIMPGGEDYYRFHAREGQQLVVAASARELIPYLADAVPGWFQATLTIYDAKGKELAYDDRYRFHPDPVIGFAVPRDGDYVVEIKDSIYRGREDFVYRITIGEVPFVTSIFPLGGPMGRETTVELKGWNLPADRLTFSPNTDVERSAGFKTGVVSASSPSTSSPPREEREKMEEPASAEASDRSAGFQTGEAPFSVAGASSPQPSPPKEEREKTASIEVFATPPDSGTSPRVLPICVRQDDKVSNLAPFAVDTLPECAEQEPNHSPASAQPVKLPIIINGRIAKPGETDVFRFEGRAGERVVAEVYARRLDSPLDSVLKLTDAAGKQLAFNDDFEDKGSGLNTDHADSYLCATLPADGTYYVYLGDTERHGGEEYAYRLRLSAPRPDFALRVTPSSINVRAGVNLPITVYALRKDGFTNAIALALKDAPSGCALGGATIPPGVDQVRVTLLVPGGVEKEVFNLALEGRALAGGEEVIRPAVPAEDMMQAFAYRHLVPAKELKVAVVGGLGRFGGGRGLVRVLGAGPVRIPASGTARVRLGTPTSAFADRFSLELNEPPEGISLKTVSPSADGAELVLQGDPARAKPGLKGNLIVNIFPGKNAAPTNQPAKRPANQRRPAAGCLPAIPFEIVE
jgi:hypothetical protein